MAQTQGEARKYIDEFIQKHLDKNDGFYITKSTKEEWEDLDYEVKGFGVGEVEINSND